jgi:hypothetical protein
MEYSYKNYFEGLEKEFQKITDDLYELIDFMEKYNDKKNSPVLANAYVLAEMLGCAFIPIMQKKNFNFTPADFAATCKKGKSYYEKLVKKCYSLVSNNPSLNNLTLEERISQYVKKEQEWDHYTIINEVSFFNINTNYFCIKIPASTKLTEHITQINHYANWLDQNNLKYQLIKCKLKNDHFGKDANIYLNTKAWYEQLENREVLITIDKNSKISANIKIFDRNSLGFLEIYSEEYKTIRITLPFYEEIGIT